MQLVVLRPTSCVLLVAGCASGVTDSKETSLSCSASVCVDGIVCVDDQSVVHGVVLNAEAPPVENNAIDADSADAGNADGRGSYVCME